ncbi:MerR family transcriptional regulator [Leifsonia aquatica]|uniref:MerR family transcriptional regulator n=1 Tax=Leifsonia aquatica TaxID=144185 RepID=UPI0028A60B70|nr:MerR family transcriptional regulator [Leifsonia aquatica]
MNTPPAGRPVYSMAIAAELLGLAPATLRLYEQKGLLTPARTAGGTRRYSADDVERMRRIADLQADGLHLSGIGRVIDLEDQNEALRRDLAEAREERGGDDGGDPAA